MNIQPLGAPATPKLDERAAPDSINLRPAAAPPADPAARPEPEAASPEAPSRAQLEDAVKKINQSLPAASQSLEFSVDDESKQTIVKIVDMNTKEVVRQIPSAEALEIAKSLDKAMGRLISQKV